jgi:uncharacterized cupin superfamily protein
MKDTKTKKPEALRIEVEHHPVPKELETLGVHDWPIWEKEVSEFPWTYDEPEVCFFLEGDVEVVPQEGASVLIRKGDLVKFPVGLSCTWKVRRPVKKHYRFG